MEVSYTLDGVEHAKTGMSLAEQYSDKLAIADEHASPTLEADENGATLTGAAKETADAPDGIEVGLKDYNADDADRLPGDIVRHRSEGMLRLTNLHSVSQLAAGRYSVRVDGGSRYELRATMSSAYDRPVC
jgi:hypothetical protein